MVENIGSKDTLMETLINKPPPFKGLDISLLIIAPINGRVFINHGSGLTTWH